MQMGGFGSGRWVRLNRKTLVGECRSIDVREWKKRGWLQPGVRLLYADGLVAFVFEDGVELRLTEIDYVNLRQLGCHLGGYRPAFVCPACDK